MKASFTSWVEDGIVHIIDQSEEVRTVSVTNDAESVIKHVLDKHGNLPVIYQDSYDDWDILLHDGNKFVGFAFGGKKKEIAFNRAKTEWNQMVNEVEANKL